MITAALRHRFAPGTSYDDATALALAEGAAAAYLSADDFFVWAKRAGYRDPVVRSAGATQVATAMADDGLRVWPRGSSEEVDWLENGMAWRVGWAGVLPEGCKAHRGHVRQAKRMRKRIGEAISAALDGRTQYVPFHLGAHSLGGSFGLLVARCLVIDLGMRPESVYTFEAPRPGNEEFHRWWTKLYGSITHRVVVVRQGEADVVTRLPPSACGWWHVGRPQIIRDGVRYESEAEWERLRADHPVRPLPQWRVLSRLVASIKAHRMGDLVETLAAMYERRKEAKWAPIEPLEPVR